MGKIIYERWGCDVHFNYRYQIGFPEHMHDQIEIMVIMDVTNDNTQLATVDGVEYELKTGDILCVFPNQMHSYGGGRCNCYITIFNSDLLRLFGEELTKLVPVSPIISNPALFEALKRYFGDAWKITCGNEKYKREKQRAIAVLIMACVLENIELKARKAIKTNAANDIFTFCNENYVQDITLDDISNKIGISKSHIVRLFREKFNTTFSKYIASLRIAEAKRLLSTTDKSITDISVEVGFNTIRSFNRTFLSVTGTSPSKYKSNNEN